WAFYFVLLLGIAFAICYLGIRQSLNVDFTFLAVEIGVCLILVGIVLFHVGQQGGLTAAPFTPGVIPAQNGVVNNLITGVILGVLSFIGFETAAALGEETRQPHCNIPRAVYGSMLVVGVFYVLMAYAGTVGYGPAHMISGYGNDPAPFDTIARRFSGGPLAAFIDLAGVLSFFGAALAIVNGGARIIFTLGRDGLFPRALGWAHPSRGTPGAAIAMLCGLGLVSGLGLNLVMKPIVAFGFLGTLDALFVLLIYLLVNIACIRFFLVKRRPQFNAVRHAIIPALGALITGGIALLAIISPGDAPLSYIPIVVGVWLALGLITLLVARDKISDVTPSVVAPAEPANVSGS
ncbi:MAG: APC family permease, partial [Chloroflexota bacterium]|nr:APC family permease [Chloroflexota bacterium]